MANLTLNQLKLQIYLTLFSRKLQVKFDLISLIQLFLRTRTNRVIFNFPITEPEWIKKTILSLETKTSLDTDNLKAKVLKKVVDQISIPLSHIINLSFESDILPNIINISRTVPVYKAGDPENCSNYWPISCLLTMWFPHYLKS